MPEVPRGGAVADQAAARHGCAAVGVVAAAFFGDLRGDAVRRIHRAPGAATGGSRPSPRVFRGRADDVRPRRPGRLGRRRDRGNRPAIKGTTLYVADASGNTVKVTASSGSRVTKTVSSTITFGAIHPGDSVVVRGTQQGNGTIAADSITLGAGGTGADRLRRRERLG